MPKPFSLHIAVGNDICFVPRIAKILRNDGGKGATSFLKRVLTVNERTQYRDRYLEPIQKYSEAYRLKNVLDSRAPSKSDATQVPPQTGARQPTKPLEDGPPRWWWSSFPAIVTKNQPEVSLNFQMEIAKLEVKRLKEWKQAEGQGESITPWKLILDQVRTGIPISSAFEAAKRDLASQKPGAPSIQEQELSSKQAETKAKAAGENLVNNDDIQMSREQVTAGLLKAKNGLDKLAIFLAGRYGPLHDLLLYSGC